MAVDASKCVAPLVNSLTGVSAYAFLLSANTSSGVATFDISDSNSGNAIISIYRGSLITVMNMSDAKFTDTISGDMKTVSITVKDSLGNNAPDGTEVRALICGE